MAGSGMNILPQYQGDYYALQNKQALAQALMQQSLTPQPLPQAVGSGGSQNYQVMPKYSALSGAAELGKALLAAKMQQQAAQGLQGLGQNQMNFLMGGQQAAPAASGMGGVPDGTTASAGPAQADPQALAQALGASGGASPPQQQAQPPQQAVPAQQQAPQQAQGGGLLAPGSAMNPSGMDVGKAAFLYQTMGPEAYAKEFVAPYVKPTDSTLNARQAGLTPAGVQAANLGAIQKNNFIAPVTGSGIFRDPLTMRPVANNPDLPAGTNPLFDASGNVAAAQPIQGAQAAMQGNSAANAAGAAQYRLSQVYNPQTKQMEYVPDASIANPGSGGGQQIPTVPTPPGMTAPPGSGSPPPLPPLPSGVVPSGRAAAAPPLGVQSDADANAKGQVDTMQKSYQNLQTVRSGAPAALQDLGNMQNLASGKSSAIIGPGMASMAGLVSPNAAEYEKSRDNLVTNLGSQLGINSDAAREMVYGSIPSYGAPKQAIANGLQTLQGQVQTRLLKAGYLTDAYTAGDAKAYNQKENQFDQNITPAIANIVTQPAGPQRSAALATAAKDPQVRARLEWAAQNGVLK